jgi:flagellar biosynthesis/type III secretory pathway protein FliH
MNWLGWHTLEIGDARVVDVDRVRELADAERLEEELREELEDTRDRLAERLRACRKAARRRGESAGRKEALTHIANAFATDRKRWDAAAERLRDATDRALQEIAPTLPASMFLEAALRRLLATRDGGTPWVIYANLSLLPEPERFLADGDAVTQTHVRVVHASYLDPGVCMVETADGLVELRGDIERDLILDAIRDAVVLGDGGSPI